MLGKVLVWLTVLMLSIPVGPFANDKKESVDSYNYVQEQKDFDEKYTVIDFEDGKEGQYAENRYSKKGITFEGAEYLKKGSHLTDVYPPHSGQFVIYNSKNLSGMVSMSFDPEVAGLVSEVGFFVTSRDDLQVRVYNFAYQEISRTIIDGPNYIGRGEPNYKYHFVSDNPIYAVTIDSIEIKYGEEGYKNSFTIDDVYFYSGETCALDVPLYKQTDSEWKDDAYGAVGWVPDNGRPNTIKAWGCALASAAMVISYHGLKQNGTSVTPQVLNNWLRKNNAYSGGSFNWIRAAEYARDVMKIELWPHTLNEEKQGDDTDLRNYLCNKQPIILHVDSNTISGHFVVATGVFEKTWIINDPFYDDNFLTGFYHNRYKGVRRFTETKLEADSMEISIHSPIEIVIKDSAGNIRSSVVEAQTERIQSTESSAYIESRYMQIDNLADGDYVVTLVGTGDGEYSISFTSTSTSGKVSSRKVSGSVEKGQHKNIEFVYDHDADEAIGDVVVTDVVPNLLNMPVFLR